MTTLVLVITLALMSLAIQAHGIYDDLDTSGDDTTSHNNTFTFDSDTSGISENAFKFDEELMLRSLAVTNMVC